MQKKQRTRSQKPSGRYFVIDALRGAALVAMFAYHFSFDLVYFRVVQANPYESAIWITCRALILTSFLLLVGISLVLANRDGMRWTPFWKRFGQLAGCALLVSIGSYLIFPKSWIYFGVLHHIAVASLLGLVFLRFNLLNLLLGVMLIIVGAFVRWPLFDAPPLHWVGLMTRKPITEDYVPLLPWFGVVMIGLFLGKRLLRESLTGIKPWRPNNTPLRLLALAGRHTLLLYMVHQPIFLGLLYLVLGKQQ
ncbi:MAG: DUF1624 domain-containing protein [Burkholderiales bacterium]|nr:DUF1624 domain-containing protein [Burkholderiales bacterium]